MPRKLDAMWEYGDPEGGFNRQTLYCKLCKDENDGGNYPAEIPPCKNPGT
jgi:hypothetical protein